MKLSLKLLLIALCCALVACGDNFEWFPDPADATPPTISASVNGKNLFLNSSTTTVGTLPANVVFSATEPATVYYTIDGNEPTIASDSVDIPSAFDRVNGPLITVSNTVLKFFGVDKSFEKNRTAIQTATIVSSAAGEDTTAPTVTAKIGTVTIVDTLDTRVVNLPATVSFTADEPAFVYYTVDGSTPTTTTATFADVATAGTFVNGPSITADNTTLKFICVDKSANRLSSAMVTTKIVVGADTTAPLVGALVSGQSMLNGDTVTTANPATVKFVANEPVTVYYTTNGTEPTTASSSVPIGAGLEASLPSPVNVTNTILWFFGVDPSNNSSSKVKGTIILN